MVKYSIALIGITDGHKLNPRANGGLNHRLKTRSLCEHAAVWNLLPRSPVEVDGR
jgi:hypothetical protein